jgi:hypothetical protein
MEKQKKLLYFSNHGQYTKECSLDLLSTKNVEELQISMKRYNVSQKKASFSLNEITLCTSLNNIIEESIQVTLFNVHQHHENKIYLLKKGSHTLKEFVGILNTMVNINLNTMYSIKKHHVELLTCIYSKLINLFISLYILQSPTKKMSPSCITVPEQIGVALNYFRKNDKYPRYP